ncbi:F-box/kelch-repeat protein At3g23880-like [Papaver somniferum]|uniref:F-box/kelch-repeat protein At3g23880-like n=1 Tax=Papaver somniferum TaxID=3469 RepID=UPI000E6FF668|nr:F-box/kelch-repeat protein At3g23880-like [Papaver somniferum]
MSSLPEDIQVEILLKLPVKSLLTCKCVCKPWLNLISILKFIHDHLSLSIQNKNNHKLMFTDTESDSGKPLIYSVDYGSISSPPDLSCDYIGNEAILMGTPFEYKEGMEVRILGACNGLFCFGICIDAETSICIWNPATREYKKIQHCDFRITPKHFPTVGFGYDSKTGGYKMVKISDSIKTGCCEVEVYTFVGSHPSKTIHTFPYIRTFPMTIFFCGVKQLYYYKVSVQGFSNSSILSFDTSNEKLTDVTLPEDSNVEMSHKTIGTLGGCLSLFLVNEKWIQAEIWVMQDYGVRKSWTKLFTTVQKQTTNCPFWMPILSLKNGDIPICNDAGFVLCDPRNERVGKVSSFFRKNNITVRTFTMLMARPESYVESLVSLNSGAYVKKPKG